jgi:cysteinyl-tRNA synthetase
MVRYEGHKMSKSLDNLVVVREALERAPAAAVRLYLVSHRYRKDWTFRWEGLAGAARLTAQLADLIGGGGGGGAGPQGEVTAPGAGTEGGAPELVREFAAALDDDLDTPRAVQVLRTAVRRRDVPAARWMAGILCGDAALR